MAIVGSVQDGLWETLPCSLQRNAGRHYVSALCHGLWPGVPLSALSVGLYQGAVTLLAVLIKPYLTDLVVTQMSLVGSAVLMLIAFNLYRM